MITSSETDSKRNLEENAVLCFPETDTDEMGFWVAYSNFTILKAPGNTAHEAIKRFVWKFEDFYDVELADIKKHPTTAEIFFKREPVTVFVRAVCIRGDRTPYKSIEKAKQLSYEWAVLTQGLPE